MSATTGESPCAENCSARLADRVMANTWPAVALSGDAQFSANGQPKNPQPTIRRFNSSSSEFDSFNEVSAWPFCQSVFQ